MTNALTHRNDMAASNGQAEGPANDPVRASRAWASAPVDVLEGPDSYLVLADAPGVRQEDLHVEYADGELRLYGKRQGERDATEYRRTFQIGQRVDVERISAHLEHGVLTVTLPKLESAKARRIPVSAAS